MRAEFQGLRMRTHAPPGKYDDHCREQVPFRLSVPFPRKPNPQQTCTPPDHAHCRVLYIVLHPGRSPSVLGECVNASPSCNQQTVEKFLASAGTLQPKLAHQKQYRKYDPVPDEGATHYEMSQTLTKVVSSAKSKSSDAAKQHLDPARYRECFPQDAMRSNHMPAYPALNAFLKM